MAIGFNLGDDDDRARRRAEDLEWENDSLLRNSEELKQAFELTRLALEAVLNVGEGVVIDARTITYLGLRLINHDWFYVVRDEDGITPYPIKARADLKHGDRLSRMNAPGKLRKVRG